MCTRFRHGVLSPKALVTNGKTTPRKGCSEFTNVLGTIFGVHTLYIIVAFARQTLLSSLEARERETIEGPLTNGPTLREEEALDSTARETGTGTDTKSGLKLHH